MIKSLFTPVVKKCVKIAASDLSKAIAEATQMEQLYIEQYWGIHQSKQKTTVIEKQKIDEMLEEASTNRKFDYY